MKIHGYKVDTMNDPYRLTRREHELYVSGEWLGRKPLERNTPGLLSLRDPCDNNSGRGCLDRSRKE